jgi:RimJ/RimL family protein N-acetyltransferase
VTSRQPSPAPASGDERILTARLELQPVVEGDAEALAEVFSDQRMYRFTGGQPGTRGCLRATFARIQAGRANDRDGTAQRNWTVRRRADGQAVGMLQAVLSNGGRSAKIAWAVGVPWQGQGIASEAAQAVVAWLEARGVRTVTAHITLTITRRLAWRLVLVYNPPASSASSGGSARSCGAEDQCRDHRRRQLCESGPRASCRTA